MNELGPLSYESAIDALAQLVIDEKETGHSNQALLVAIEGQSNSGKSSLSSALSSRLQKHYPATFSIEGDKFHIGRRKSMEIYHFLISSIEAGNPLLDNFPQLIWKFDMMREQLISKIYQFNQSSDSDGRITLEGVLEDKYDETEHDESYEINRNSIILVLSIYLRHMSFGYIISLQISLEMCIERKIERTRRIGDKRDPRVTRAMCELIEYPAMIAHREKYPIEGGVEVDINDFENIYLRVLQKKLSGEDDGGI